MIGYLIFHCVINFLLFLRGALNQRNLKKSIYTAILIATILFSGFRYGVGNDFFIYETKYSDLSNLKIYEYGYYILSSFARLLDSFQTLIFLTSALVIYGYYRFMSYFSSNVYVSIIIFSTLGFFLLGSFNLIRQYIATSLFLLALVYADKAKPKLYLMLCLLATSFHLSAIITLPMYFLTKRFSIKAYFIFLLSYVVFLSGFQTVVGYTSYSIYLDSRWAYVMQNERNEFFLLIYFLASMVIIIALKRGKEFKQKDLILNMHVLSFITILTSYILNYLPNMLFFRINNYFLPVFLISTPYFLQRISLRIRPIMIVLVTVTCYAYLIYTLQSRGEEINLMPYTTFLNK